MRASPPPPRARSGSALVLVLIVVTILSVLVGSLAFEARLEAQYARYLTNRDRATQLAQSGIEVAKMLMSRAGGAASPGGQTDEEDRWHDAAERLKLGQSLVGLVEPVGESGWIVLDIEPEPGRLNVNLLTREDWETILGNAGVPEEYFDYIVDPVLDWMDDDDTSNPKGAETEDYYSLLDPPYEAKNGPFDTVRELLLVKGFPEALLAGGVFDPTIVRGDTEIKSSDLSFNRFSDTNDLVIAGIEGMLTTYGDGKVNIQSAPYDVLRTLPGVDDILARAIMEERDAVDENGDPDPFKSADDLFSRIDGLDPAISSRITVASSFYRITATGRAGNVERRIWGVAYSDGDRLRFLRWVEEP